MFKIHKAEYKYALTILCLLSDIKVSDQVSTGKEIKTGVSVKLDSSTNPEIIKSLKCMELLGIISQTQNNKGIGTICPEL